MYVYTMEHLFNDVFAVLATLFYTILYVVTSVYQLTYVSVFLYLDSNLYVVVCTFA